MSSLNARPRDPARNTTRFTRLVYPHVSTLALTPCSYFVVCHLSTLNCCCNVQAMIEGNLPLSLGAVAGAAVALLL